MRLGCCQRLIRGSRLDSSIATNPDARVGLVADSRMAAHDMGPGHPEWLSVSNGCWRPRAHDVLYGCNSCQRELQPTLNSSGAPTALCGALVRKCRGTLGHNTTVQAARLAAGGVLAAVDAVGGHCRPGLLCRSAARSSRRASHRRGVLLQ